MKTQTIHASELNQGDTVLINGKTVTVGENTVKSGYFGTLVCGERFDGGLVERVLWPKWYKGEIVDYVPQI